MGDASTLRFSTARLATGPRLHYAEQGAPGGHAILFLHGWPDSWFSFSRVLPLLPERYHAFAVDQRGFGDSERPDRGYRIEDLAADAAGFLDAVASSHGGLPSPTLSGSPAWRASAAPCRPSTT